MFLSWFIKKNIRKIQTNWKEWKIHQTLGLVSHFDASHLFNTKSKAFHLLLSSKDIWKENTANCCWRREFLLWMVCEDGSTEHNSEISEHIVIWSDDKKEMLFAQTARWNIWIYFGLFLIGIQLIVCLGNNGNMLQFVRFFPISCK